MSETSRTEHIGYKPNYRAGAGGGMQISLASPEKTERQGPNYYCRGCGCALPSDFHGHFHKECLRADKRRRVQARRKGEQARFEHWLQKQHCHNCGARYAEMRSNSSREASCEASQAAKERDPRVYWSDPSPMSEGDRAGGDQEKDSAEDL
jgi:hypothetical protein